MAQRLSAAKSERPPERDLHVKTARQAIASAAHLGDCHSVGRRRARRGCGCASGLSGEQRRRAKWWHGERKGVGGGSRATAREERLCCDLRGRGVPEVRWCTLRQSLPIGSMHGCRHGAHKAVCFASPLCKPNALSKPSRDKQDKLSQPDQARPSRDDVPRRWLPGRGLPEAWETWCRCCPGSWPHRRAGRATLCSPRQPGAGSAEEEGGGFKGRGSGAAVAAATRG